MHCAMKTNRASILEHALRRPFRENMAVRRMIIDAIDEGPPDGVERIRAAFRLGYPDDETVWSYLSDARPREIMDAAWAVAAKES